MISGYLGTAEIGEVVLDAVAKVKAANKRALYCCDPVIGDSGKSYVQGGIAEFFSDRALAAADVLTPNQFELEHALRHQGALHGRRGESLRRAAREGPEDRAGHQPKGRRHAARRARHFRVRRWRASARADAEARIAVQGTGDTVAALFFFHLLRTGTLSTALEVAASSMFGVLERTQATKAKEMLLVDAQEEFISPSRNFRAEAIEG